MDDSLKHHHLHNHTRKIISLLLIAIIILAAGEYYLYRQQLQIKTMISEGMMQLKEEMKTDSAMTPAPLMK